MSGAILYYDKATHTHYDLPLNNKGVALGNLGNHTGAILYYDKALAVDPKHENALYNKGPSHPRKCYRSVNIP